MVPRILFGAVALVFSLGLFGLQTVHAVRAHKSAQGTQARHVAIRVYTYRPATLTVKQGTMVVWTNDDSTMHTVSFSSGIGSTGLGHGTMFRRRFMHVGVFRYHCAFHAFMQGTIKVIP